TTTDAAPLVEDDRLKLLTFTGSPAVGWGLKNRAGMKRVTLELGGNAAVVVAADADAGYAAERIVWGGTANAGQTCISVQRVYHPPDTLEALDRAGASEFGLQAGLFTNDMRIVDAAFERIEVGGLMVNDVSTFRVDHMPYGGVKRSGFGREGLRYAIEEMTEL